MSDVLVFVGTADEALNEMFRLQAEVEQLKKALKAANKHAADFCDRANIAERKLAALTKGGQDDVWPPSRDDRQQNE